MSGPIDRTGQVWIFDVRGTQCQLTFLEAPTQNPMRVHVKFTHKIIMRYEHRPDEFIYMNWIEDESAPFENNPTYARVV